MALRALPAVVIGPVDFLAFSRLAERCLSVRGKVAGSTRFLTAIKIIVPIK